MLEKADYKEASKCLIENVEPTALEEVALEDCMGRVLGEDFVSKVNIPPFDRSPLDGYAFRSIDSKAASKANPIRLRIIEEVVAGAVPTKEVGEGEATKILTGAAIPKGADCVSAFEITEFNDEYVTIFKEYVNGENIIYAGEDVKCGDLLASAGSLIDVGLMGTLASVNRARVKVYKKPKIGIISTGSEILEPGEKAEAGKIFNSNRFTFAGALEKMGCEALYLGSAADDYKKIAELVNKGFKECDGIITTGGVSVGDYDLTPKAMDSIGVKGLIKGVAIKPGMASYFGVKDNKPVFGLSGNPASSLVNFYAVVMPAIKKMTGLKNFESEEFEVETKSELKKKSNMTRLIRGKLVIEAGKAFIDFSKNQGNVVLSSLIDADIMAVVPAGTKEVPKGMRLNAFKI